MADFLGGKSNVVWCEYVVEPFAYSRHVGEFWNTASNLFYVAVGIHGLQKSLRDGHSRAHAFTNAMLVIVGCGSAVFHMTQSFVGQLLDEAPMSLLALGYLHCTSETHWLTSKPHKGRFFALVYAVVAAAWLVYLKFNIYWIFQATFVLQVITPALISLTVGPEPTLSRARSDWFVFLALVLLGKIGWDVEQWLYHSQQCPTSAWDPRFWLHANWHACSALAHAAWMTYAGRLELAARKGKAD
eukprot:TRINITY_DN74325_c0_g1_i1.p1 TRINITY_DN74325_c0_g1~~TRINITY_DN74325_c0_g1_i1.p1  ORF type:complete len:243 (-),score=44.78 TRINITY_DN74325_c0_g1_i1:47-775(-)